MMLSNNHDLFINEVINDYILKYERFKEYQTAAVETLQFFHEVCIKYDIPYFLAYGSLLGAMRDGGQIPWDYDIDVHVPICYANELINALQNEGCEKYHFITRFKDKSYRTYTLKLAPKKYDCEVLHVDVFWLYDIKNTEFEKHKNIVKKYSNILLYKFLHLKYFMYTRKSEKIIYKLNKIRSKFYNTSIIDKYFNRLFSNQIQKTEYLTDNDNSQLFRKEWFIDRVLYNLPNGMKFYVPSGYESILKHIYGDYKCTPPLESRINEFVKSLNRLDNLGKL